MRNKFKTELFQFCYVVASAEDPDFDRSYKEINSNHKTRV